MAKVTSILTGLALCTTVLTAEIPKAWNVRDHIPVKKFVIQSHRGAGVLAAENTIEAFELAWKMGTIPEADLRTTKDGVIVAFHDGDFSRVVKNAGDDLRKKGVKDLTFEELSKLEVGAERGTNFVARRVSKMSEVFALMKNRPERNLYLDIKNVDLKQLAAEVNSAKVSKQVILASTKYDLISEWKKLVPKSQTLHWMGGSEDDLKSRIAGLRAQDFKGITQLQIHVHLNTNSPSAEPFRLSRGFIQSLGAELRERGIVYQAIPWGIAEPEVYWKLLDLGVASFATDYPDVTLKAVKDYYEQKR